MQSDKSIEVDPSPEIEHRNPVRELGFAQIEHVITLDKNLSDGAYRTLGILHYFWQQKTSAYPSVETLADLRGVTVTTISRHLAELTDRKIISRERRVGTSSITYLEDLPQEYHDAATSILQKRRDNKNAKIAKMSGPTLQKSQIQPDTNVTERRTIEEKPNNDNKLTPVAAVPAKESEEKTKLAFREYQRVISFNFSATMAEKIKDEIEDVPIQCIKYAFDQAEAQNVKKWSYVQGILDKLRANAWQIDTKKNGNGASQPQVPRYAESWVNMSRKFDKGESLQACFDRLKREGRVESNAVMWVP